MITVPARAAVTARVRRLRPSIWLRAWLAVRLRLFLIRYMLNNPPVEPED